MVTGFLKVLVTSVEFKLGLDIRVIPKAIDIFCICKQKIYGIHGARAAAAMKKHLPHQPLSPFLSAFCQSSIEIFSYLGGVDSAFMPAINDGGGVMPRCSKALKVSILPRGVL